MTTLVVNAVLSSVEVQFPLTVFASVDGSLVYDQVTELLLRSIFNSSTVDGLASASKGNSNTNIVLVRMSNGEPCLWTTVTFSGHTKGNSGVLDVIYPIERKSLVKSLRTHPRLAVLGALVLGVSVDGEDCPNSFDRIGVVVSKIASCFFVEPTFLS